MIRKFAERVLSSIARRTAHTAVASQPHKSASPPDETGDPGGAHIIALDYPTSSSNSSRWGVARPHHAELQMLIEATMVEQRSLLQKVLQVSKYCGEIADTLDESDPRPRWINPMIAGLDACLIGAFLLDDPIHYLEIGSGHSTKFARHFLQKLGLRTRLISVDPHPRAECDALCDEILRFPLENVNLDVFNRIQPGDVLFMDGSHRCFMNSDVTVFFLDVLPALKPGVIVGIHDIFLPDDYPHVWAKRYYNEEYLLAAYLLGARDRVKVLFATDYQCRREESRETIRQAQSLSGCPDGTFHGCSFWFTRGA